MFVPKEKSQDGVFISTSFDPTSHFENETEDVLQLYKQITGKDVDLENIPEDETDQWGAPPPAGRRNWCQNNNEEQI